MKVVAFRYRCFLFSLLVSILIPTSHAPWLSNVSSAERFLDAKMVFLVPPPPVSLFKSIEYDDDGGRGGEREVLKVTLLSFEKILL